MGVHKCNQLLEVYRRKMDLQVSLKPLRDQDLDMELRYNLVI